jgi:hypothetical protein
MRRFLVNMHRNLAIGAALVAFAACGPSESPTVAIAAAGPSSSSLPSPVERRIAEGETLFFGKGGCSTCHSVGTRGTMERGPNLGSNAEFPEPFARRAPGRRPGVDTLAYAIESILHPDAFVVPGFAPGVMKSVDDLPTRLSDGDIIGLALYVSSIGATTLPTEADIKAARTLIDGVRKMRQQP